MAEHSLAAGAPASTPDQSSPQPVQGAERLMALDFIRGVAVLGILFANITAFGHPFLAYYWPEALPGGGNAADDWIWLCQFVLVDGKFRGLFTILFGAGMILFMERAWQRGHSLGLQARRLAFLLVFGFLHFALLFIGDILFLYALSGFVGLLFLEWSAKRQFWWGLVWYIVGSLLLIAMLGSQVVLEQMPDLRAATGDLAQQMQAAWGAEIGDAAATTAIMQQGSFADIVAFRLTEQSDMLTQSPLFALIETIPLMLLGMALYRFGFFSGELDSARMRRWGWIGLVGGALASLALGWWAFALAFPPYLTSFVFNGAAALPRLPMILGMAALLTLWAPRAAQGWLGERFVAAGRMAFSNYIGTSVLMLPVFQGWAGAQFGELHRAELLVVVIIAWAIMLAWSKPWLARFRYGPLEWLWRCLTYGRMFPFRR